ncbi:MAG: hypothetical protein AB8H03_02995 [Saprospiraceae bacterium]
MKKIISPIVILNLIFLTLISFGCEEKKKETPEERLERINLAVAEKFAKRRAERMNLCKENAIKIAEQRVDSALIAQAKLTTIDTTGRPIKPIKPDLPEITPPKDSTDVKPLFEEIPDTIQ